ncbi:ethylene-responsive transcription factor RAP2-1-like [Diospyros lotus]|uniref:ethylene-responsive transcription factor RAP2-1-like n=1 Tax=Diospyros lotus TaxID=55363 RepID=UPI0022525950|nr:ethylene-responsive transcription factor RAP2-1-like [Diospyros lotus]
MSFGGRKKSSELSPMEAGECCSSSSTSTSTSAGAERQHHRRQRQNQLEKPYRGIRMRKWGKWVAEIREPNKRSRIWLGSYSTPIAAARAYDTAVFYLRGRSARLNFPEYIAEEDEPRDMTADSIRKKATEVGARVDALETGALPLPHGSGADSKSNSGRVSVKPDLNEYPNPEDSDEE